ncbi:arsenate reductase family protein [Dysgonomonas sp. 521]|uniref:arsenate reductase family protein n=1 Tax=Dysgonomonas sp. 521 TaxID=2302932 RepID=UPI0013D6DC2A|nr:arsenate reductase family protein [Dysgonomonas sp. 521]NDV93782.1 arsenate reductase family protein [Dysgonomonas sp. 521]
MASILFLQYPKCGTCQKAAKWLKENDINVESRDITKENPTETELAGWIKKSGLPVSKFFNTSGRIYKENNLKEKVKSGSEAELISILSSDGMVVKRPIVVAGDFVLVGFNEEEWQAKLK